MHPNEIPINRRIVQGLIDEQFPEFAGLPLTRVESIGTVNAIYRLGDNMAVRLPRLAQWSSGLTKEVQILPLLAQHTTLETPEPVALGRATEAFPVDWAIYRWIDGESYQNDVVTDEREVARDLAGFVKELRNIAIPSSAPQAGRLPLAELVDDTVEAIKASGVSIDQDRTLEAWERSITSPVWDGHPVWIHADLLKPNLLLKAGRLSAVLDFGSAGVGDPAFDLVPAWSVFGPAGRLEYIESLGIEPGVWQRARGYALHQAALIVPYYKETNPAFVSLAKKTIEQVLIDMEGGDPSRVRQR